MHLPDYNKHSESFIPFFGRGRINLTRVPASDRAGPGIDFTHIIMIQEVFIMAKYVCGVCGWEYDPEVGVPEAGIEPGTPWEDVPEDFVCPLCGVDKDQFEEA